MKRVLMTAAMTVAGLALLAPGTASAWEGFCSVELDKCIRVDDGDEIIGEEPCLDMVQVEVGDEISWVVEVTNPSDYAISECTVYDPALFPEEDGYTSAPFSLDPGDSETFTVGGLVDVCEDFQNTAVVTCSVCGVEDVTDFTDQDTAELECEEEEEGEGCLTRTPGYWGNHPAITAMFLPVTSCGVTYSTPMAGMAGSITEDICISGREARMMGEPMQQLQLRRQCAAAHLNLAATGFFGGSCEAEYEDLAATLAYCCEEVCTGGYMGSEIGETLCIEMIDEFNNSYEYMLDGMSLCPNYELGTTPPCSADTSQCQLARGTGRVLPPVAPADVPSAHELKARKIKKAKKKSKALRR